MRVLFIGGTGRISKDVAQLAVEKGYDVFLLTRGSEGRKIFISEGVHMLYGNIRDPKSCEKYFLEKEEYYDVVIDFLTYEIQDLKEVLALINGCYRQYIFISSATVYRRIDGIITEEAERGNDLWDYAYNKYLCEEYLKKYFRDKEGTFYTIIRPYVTYGNTRVPYPLVPRNKKYEWSLVERIINGQIIPVFNEGSTVTALLYATDFAKLVVGTFGNKNAYNEEFHIADEEETTWRCVLKEISESVETELRVKDISILDICRYLPQYKLVLYGDKGIDVRFSMQKIKSIVPDFKKEISLEYGIKEMIKFYENHPEKRLINYYWNGQIDRLLVSQGCRDSYSYDFKSLKNWICYVCGYFELLYFPYMVFQRLMKVRNPLLRKFKNIARRIYLKRR